MDAFYDYVANDTGAFRLVFESDLTNEPAVREHVERVTTECADADRRGDPRRHRPARRGLAAARGLPGGNGPGQRAVLARRRPAASSGREAAALVSGLAWRGIRGYPLTDDH